MLAPHWQQFIQQQQTLPYFNSLQHELASQRSNGVVIYPAEENIFNAFKFADIEQVRVVILGQDPYHGPNQAHGLAFSVNEHIKIPPSLVNIYKELATDIENFTVPEHGNLTAWAEQGVLLLNAVLTVPQGQANGHANMGWEIFTDNVISTINEQNTGCVFILWGAYAQKKGKNIDANKHCILKGPHPSPLSAYRGFFGCKHFSSANAWLVEHHKQSIDWGIPLP
jgi:uracil-DNA glycosylase